jgi:4-hydroxy-4-methyl-2-oxoglutarate aldolase
MIDNPPLLTIHRGHPRPSAALLDRFRGVQTSHLCDAMDGRGALHHRIKPVDPANARFCGPALTAWSYPADMVGTFGALAEAQAGDVILVACDGFQATAAIGDLVAGMMKNKGVAAFVTDGMARDRSGIVAAGLPLFAAGITPNSPARNGPGTVGTPIVIGEVAASPGDIVVGDADGVVIVPLARAAEVADRLDAIRAAEAQAEARVRDGATDPPGLAAILAGARVIASPG